MSAYMILYVIATIAQFFCPTLYLNSLNSEFAMFLLALLPFPSKCNSMNAALYFFHVHLFSIIVHVYEQI